MSSPIITQLPKNRVELKFSISPDEVKPFLEQAAAELSTNRPIPGFRPGKAPYAELKKAYGEMAIWETAVEKLVRTLYVKAVLGENIETVGSPEIAVQKLVPNETVEFTATANLMPAATKLADVEKPWVERKSREVGDAEVEDAIQEIRKMRRTEAAADKTAAKEDMVEIDMDILKDNVIVEGGQAKNFKIYLNEPTYIPGLADQLVGTKKGDEKTFELPFPEDHYSKELAGKMMTFNVTVKGVYEMVLPEANDAFAKGLGLESIAELKTKLKDNLQLEADQKADEAAEIELLDKLVGESRFSEIPDLLVTEETRRMINELEHAVEAQGGRFEDYLSNLKKTREDLLMDFVPQAVKRIQTAVLIKEVAKAQHVEVDEDEVDREIDQILASVGSDAKARERVSAPEYRDYVSAQLRNRKVIAKLKEKGIKK